MCACVCACMRVCVCAHVYSIHHNMCLHYSSTECIYSEVVVSVYLCILSCWLPPDNGVVWAFIAPMFLSIIVSSAVVLLCKQARLY